MIVYKGRYNEIAREDKLTVTIGNFDGIHLGHLALINKVLSFTDTNSGVITFSPHPKELFTGDAKTLNSDEDKISRLKDFSIDVLFMIDFDNDFANLSKDEFIKWLKQIGVVRICVGRDFGFGKGKSGNVSDLAKHFELVTVDDFKINDIRVSSSIIKELIYKGDFNQVEKLLGYKYSVRGRVVDGDKVGRTLNFPTANVDYGKYYLPKTGVYYVDVKYLDKVYVGVCSIGYNVTLNKQDKIRFEVFIINEKLDLYNKEITVTFNKYLREEIKFSTKEALIKQIQNDVLLVEKLSNMIK